MKTWKNRLQKFRIEISFSIDLAAQTAKKQKSRTTGHLNWGFSRIFFLEIPLFWVNKNRAHLISYVFFIQIETFLIIKCRFYLSFFHSRIQKTNVIKFHWTWRANFVIGSPMSGITVFQRAVLKVNWFRKDFLPFSFAPKTNENIFLFLSWRYIVPK